MKVDIQVECIAVDENFKAVGLKRDDYAVNTCFKLDQQTFGER